MHIPDTIYFDSLIVVNFLNGGALCMKQLKSQASLQVYARMLNLRLSQLRNLK